MAHQSRRVEYRCSNPKCRAVDYWDDFDTIPLPACINCHHCGAGRGLQVAQMDEKKIGMFPVRQVPNIHEVPSQGSQPS